MKGIDVSKHQGKIDWQKVKAAGVEFVIIRAGYGMYADQEDPYFRANMQGAKAAGIPAGIFWYSYAETAAQAEKEAEICLQVIGPYKAQLALPVFFDQEYEPGILAQDNETRTAMCKAFLQKMEQAGCRAGLYCSLDWYRNKVDSAKLAGYPVWIAQYAPKCSYQGSNLICWQYSSKGLVDGIKGDVDLDEGYSGLLTSSGKSGWVQASSAWYWYEDGAPVKSRWVKDGGWWYYLGQDGKMLTGYQQIGGKLYYLNERRYDKGGWIIPYGACVITDGSGAVV